jgi:hypothetical protein
VTAATLILACVAAAALVLLAGLQIADRVRRPRALERRLRKTVLVHRVGLPSIRGVLVEDAPDGLVLRRAQYLLEPEHRGEPAPEPVALDGDTIVPWELIDCVQDLQLTAAHAPRRRPAAVGAPTGGAIAASFQAAPSDPRARRAA